MSHRGRVRMVLVIDNYDSFVYNLARYVEELGFTTMVRRNDAVDLNFIQELQPSHLLISPGPCTPKEAGISVAAIKTFAGKIPILGVCLGHQALAVAFGGEVVRAKKPMHGKSSIIMHHNRGIFRGVQQSFLAGRYHSLIVSGEQLPEALQVEAWSQEDEIMALAHQSYLAYGVQFHPESIMTESGYALLSNFMHLSY